MNKAQIICGMIQDGVTPQMIAALVRGGYYTEQEWDAGIELAGYYDEMENAHKESLLSDHERAAQFIADGVVSPDAAINARQEYVRRKFEDSVRAGKPDPRAKASYQALYSKTLSETDIKRAAEYPLEKLVTCRNGMARCPFHNEKTPSMHITRNLFHCFGCGVGGDTIHFVRKSQGFGFTDAVRYINSL